MGYPEDEDIQKFLEHYGVKGQKWGVRKEEVSGGDSRSKSDEPNVISKDDLDDKEYSEQLRSKYGKDTLGTKKTSSDKPLEEQSGFLNLSPNQKKAAIALGGVALVAGSAFLYSKYTENNKVKYAKALEEFNKLQIEDLLRTAQSEPALFGVGLAHHWDQGVELGVGSIVQRMSTVKETDIRPGGFFAAFKEADVERYKAKLPLFWKQWGYPEQEGYLTQIRALTDIKAPSGKESISILADLIDDDNVLINMGYRSVTSLSGEQRSLAIEGVARKAFLGFAQQWYEDGAKDPHVQKYFSEVKARGYNALIDFNDSGRLSETPMRFIDGTLFEIVGNNPVSKDAIALAQKNIPYLEMSATTVLDFLEHYGVKGQRWGVRKEQDTEKSSRTKKILVTAGVGLVAAGTIFVASRNTKVRQMSSSVINKGRASASNQLQNSGTIKAKEIRAAQIKQIQAYNKKQLLRDPEFAKMTPEKLMAQHEKSKAEFDRWLVLKERDLGYLYKGPK